MSSKLYRPRYKSKAYITLEQIFKEGVVASGKANAVSLHRLCKTNLVYRKLVNFPSCPYYYYLTEEGKELMIELLEIEKEKIYEDTFFAV